MIIRESFPISFENREIWVGCFDGLGDKSKIVKIKFLEEYKEIKLPSSPALIAMNVYGTVITCELAEIFINTLNRNEKLIRKVAFSGLTKEGLRNIKSYIKTSNVQLNFAINYFDDFEEAKEWLI
ncbi:hypothetical protein [Inconstantimicrobium mannanitabidum]|uniref:Uncharacterized protein n=1 Tax=Inconstantimicrobium mannanitabidum TaxID=1604901 RepID=A0ACB5R9B8_9CLOT|nr:hypothetical protein [Clostridium sp. TW13]GKX65775.1 hypothetical protein rsdtw13_10330 [Clostridium sp. TW13]